MESFLNDGNFNQDSREINRTLKMPVKDYRILLTSQTLNALSRKNIVKITPKRLFIKLRAERAKSIKNLTVIFSESSVSTQLDDGKLF